MGHLGFSYTGAVYLVMLFVPNILWARNRPAGYSAESESRVMQALERLGEIGVICCALIFKDLNPRPWSPWSHGELLWQPAGHPSAWSGSASGGIPAAEHIRPGDLACRCGCCAGHWAHWDSSAAQAGG